MRVRDCGAGGVSWFFRETFHVYCKYSLFWNCPRVCRLAVFFNPLPSIRGSFLFCSSARGLSGCFLSSRPFEEVRTAAVVERGADGRAAVA